MTKQNEILAKIKDAIGKSRTFFIAGHIKPDGDTVGTALALSSLLKRMGKKPEIYSREPVPGYFSFLNGIGRIKVAEKVCKEYDCAIILECANAERMGDIISMEQAAFVINIDHHAHYNNFGHINYIDPEASSSAQQVFNLFKYLGHGIKKDEAEALYVGLVTDTGKFQQTNTTTAAFDMASELVKSGVQPPVIYEKIYASKSYSALKLLGLALNTLNITPSGLVSYVEIKHSMYHKSHSNVTETEDIINHTMMIPGTTVGMLFRETEAPGIIKVSFRSRSGFDVNKIAQHFGGGGHKNAAGCSVKGNLTTAKRAVLKYLGKFIKID
ncbi:MAG: bifunctional oligoribonuclease/PAP phosphatase NrnA [Elusimicrobiota bacterium]